MYRGERFNSIAHLIGAAASIAGVAVLVVFASMKGDPWKIVSFSIYGATLLILYTCSVLHHSLKGRVFLILDYAAIYMLIAGTYTPIVLVTIRGPWGWSLFGVLWGLAVLGIVIDSLPLKGRRIVPIVIYLLMGWMALLAIVPIFRELGPAGFSLILLGGVIYTVGVVFFLMGERGVKWAHEVWHMFVLAGSAVHYLAMLFFVL